MRWLLRKDLLILGRSRLLLVLLVLYPLAIALLIGLALSRGPSQAARRDRRRNPAGRGDPPRRPALDVSPLRRRTAQPDEHRAAPRRRADAVAKVKTGEVLAAIVIPPDLAARRRPRAPSGADLEVIYNGNALEQSLVRSEIESDLAEGEPRLLRTDPARRRRARSKACCAAATCRNSAWPGADRPGSDPRRARSHHRRASRPGRPARSCARSTKLPRFASENLDAQQAGAGRHRAADRGQEQAPAAAAARRSTASPWSSRSHLADVRGGAAGGRQRRAGARGGRARAAAARSRLARGC